MADGSRIKIEDSELRPLRHPDFSCLGPVHLWIAPMIRDEEIPCEVGKMIPRNPGYFPVEDGAGFALDP